MALTKEYEFGIVVRSTGERTESAVLDALDRDPYVREVLTLRFVTPLCKAVAHTHDIFAEWVGEYEYVMSIDADVIPLPGFGKWISDLLNVYQYPEYSRWLPPLLDWVVQGRWRTAGGIFVYRTEETSKIAARVRETWDLVEPEHNYDIFSDLRGLEWRPPLEQVGSVVSIHQYEQDWDMYFYRGIIHTLRIKNWLRPGVHKYAERGFPEYKVFLAGIEWAKKNPGIFTVESADYRSSQLFKEVWDDIAHRLCIPKERGPCPSYEELVETVINEFEPGMKPI